MSENPYVRSLTVRETYSNWSSYEIVNINVLNNNLARSTRWWQCNSELIWIFSVVSTPTKLIDYTCIWCCVVVNTVRGSDGTLLLRGPPNCEENAAFQRWLYSKANDVGNVLVVLQMLFSWRVIISISFIIRDSRQSRYTAFSKDGTLFGWCNGDK